MATRMIMRNFSLSADYSYKAALAKAYVGFRDEAKSLDPIFRERLFAAAITQLDANPVRLIDAAHPGSPLQDLLQQPFMQQAMLDPAVKIGLLNWLKARFGKSPSFPTLSEQSSPPASPPSATVPVAAAPAPTLTASVPPPATASTTVPV